MLNAARFFFGQRDFEVINQLIFFRVIENITNFIFKKSKNTHLVKNINS